MTCPSGAQPPAPPDVPHYVTVVTGGTADIPVAEEAAVTAELLGSRVERLYDVGVAGLHRLLDRRPRLVGARVNVVVAGMEGALASVVAGLVANPVINWTLSNRRVRLIIPIGVAYGSDISLVMETLMASAIESSKVAKTPEPQVLFLSFGESSLDFELRVWLTDVDERLKVTSELHQDIDKRFREAKIEIAFPQRDLHLRSADESILLRPPETPK